MLMTACLSLSSSSSIVPADNTSSTFPLLGAMCDPVHALNEVAMEHQFFFRQQNLKALSQSRGSIGSGGSES